MLTMLKWIDLYCIAQCCLVSLCCVLKENLVVYPPVFNQGLMVLAIFTAVAAASECLEKISVTNLCLLQVQALKSF